MTTNNVEALANLAATALASYGEHESNSDLKASLKEGGFSDTQAEQFIDRYQYVDNLEKILMNKESFHNAYFPYLFSFKENSMFG
jgi:hypothetical protein